MCDVEMQSKFKVKGMVKWVSLNCTSEEPKLKLYVLFKCKLLLQHTGDIIIAAKNRWFLPECKTGRWPAMTGCVAISPVLVYQ